tara:strand:+ start:189 stop:446 length:258 start_codon:yes stop_codon:yes gene_type:complete
MLPPIRCVTCADIIDYKYYENLLKTNIPQKDVFNNMNVHKYCCRRMYLGVQDELTDILIGTACTGFEDSMNKLSLGVSSEKFIQL